MVVVVLVLVSLAGAKYGLEVGILYLPLRVGVNVDLWARLALDGGCPLVSAVGDIIVIPLPQLIKVLVGCQLIFLLRGKKENKKNRERTFPRQEYWRSFSYLEVKKWGQFPLEMELLPNSRALQGTFQLPQNKKTLDEALLVVAFIYMFTSALLSVLFWFNKGKNSSARFEEEKKKKKKFD